MAWAILLHVGGRPANAWAESKPNIFSLGFEDEQVSWRAGNPELTPLIQVHRRTKDGAYEGEQSEQFQFVAPSIVADQRVTLDVPNSRVFDELRVSVWVRSNCPNLRLALRLRCPHQIDPRTGKALAIEFVGGQYSRTPEWQRLECHTSDESIASRLIRVRGQLASGFGPVLPDFREMYVDQVSLLFQVPKGRSALEIDQLDFGPIVTPTVLVESGDAPTATRSGASMTIADDRIARNGEPFFPVFTLYHGESLDAIASTGVNTLWIPDYRNRPLLKALADMDLGAIAQPPQPTPEQAVLNRSGIPTFPDWTDAIWAWMLGFDVPADDQQYVSGWAHQVRDADRESQRPILVDVDGNERSFHRNVDLLGSSDFTMQTTISSLDHFRHLQRRRELSLPGKPMFTFVQTEASSALLDHFADDNVIPIIEPEQILHQGYAAIAAGYKGVAFWKQIPLDTNVSGLNERIHAIQIFSRHCRILESWLASSRVIDEIPAYTGQEFARRNPGKLSPLSSPWDPTVVQAAHLQQKHDSPIRATVLRTDYGLMILPAWYEQGGQCVPGPQATQEIRLLVRGTGEVTQAWEVTPTSVSSFNLELDRPAGGTEIRLKNFDQHAVIVVTSDPAAVDELNRKCRQHRHAAAQAYVSLAELKFSRVKGVHDQLVSLAPEISDAEVILRRALFRIEEARRELEAGHDDDARVASQKALRELRLLQRLYWESAIDPLPSVATSLLATNFQTLPAHWRLLADMGKASSLSANMLPSGSFEDEQSLLESWRDGSDKAASTRLQLRPGGSAGKLHLLMAVDSPDSSPLILIGPEIPVRSSDIVVMTGQIQIPRPLQSGADGLQIFETLVGRQGAVRFRENTQGWKSFKLVRRPPQDGTLRLRFELHGQGEVHLDDVRVHLLSNTR